MRGLPVKGIKFKNIMKPLNEIKKQTKEKCRHSFVMDCGGNVIRMTTEGLIEEEVVGRGTYCIKCGYKPKVKETPQVLKDFSKLVVRKIQNDQ